MVVEGWRWVEGEGEGRGRGTKRYYRFFQITGFALSAISQNPFWACFRLHYVAITTLFFKPLVVHNKIYTLHFIIFKGLIDVLIILTDDVKLIFLDCFLNSAIRIIIPIFHTWVTRLDNGDYDDW